MVDANGTFEEGSVRIMENQDQVLRSKTVRLVKVLWQHRGVEEQHGNVKILCVPTIPSCSRKKVCF